jgi:hypothetical protein
MPRTNPLQHGLREGAFHAGGQNGRWDGARSQWRGIFNRYGFILYGGMLSIPPYVGLRLALGREPAPRHVRMLRYEHGGTV